MNEAGTGDPISKVLTNKEPVYYIVELKGSTTINKLELFDVGASKVILDKSNIGDNTYTVEDKYIVTTKKTTINRNSVKYTIKVEPTWQTASDDAVYNREETLQIKLWTDIYTDLNKTELLEGVTYISKPVTWQSKIFNVKCDVLSVVDKIYKNGYYYSNDQDVEIQFIDNNNKSADKAIYDVIKGSEVNFFQQLVNDGKIIISKYKEKNEVNSEKDYENFTLTVSTAVYSNDNGIDKWNITFKIAQEKIYGNCSGASYYVYYKNNNDDWKNSGLRLWYNLPEGFEAYPSVYNGIPRECAWNKRYKNGENI